MTIDTLAGQQTRLSLSLSLSDHLEVCAIMLVGAMICQQQQITQRLLHRSVIEPTADQDILPSKHVFLFRIIFKVVLIINCRHFVALSALCASDELAFASAVYNCHVDDLKVHSLKTHLCPITPYTCP